MNRKILFALSFVFTLIGLSSCSENQEENEYENWQAKNEHFIDSIAAAARAGQGRWEMIRAYNISDSTKNDKNSYFIYVQKLWDGEGTTRPEFRDSVRVHYKGYLLPSKSYASGYMFEKSYNGAELDVKTDVPKLFGVNGVLVGFSTALMHMVEGDRWRVVIPYYLGYGTGASGKIPGYSTLIYDMELAKIYKYQVDKNTSWW